LYGEMVCTFSFIQVPSRAGEQMIRIRVSAKTTSADPNCTKNLLLSRSLERITKALAAIHKRFAVIGNQLDHRRREDYGNWGHIVKGRRGSDE